MKRLVVLTAVAAMMMVGGIAHAAWLAGGSGFGTAEADTMPTGATPTAEVVAGTSDVSVSWIASTMPSDGEPVDGYTVIRYAEGETTGTAATADCDGHVTGTQCVEKDVPAGDWEYTVTPRQGANWVGSAGPRSQTVTVVPPTAPTLVELANAGNNEPGRADHNDTVTVRFSGQLDADTICPGRDPDSSFTLDANNEVTVTIRNNAGTTGNDVVEVTATDCGSGLRFGTIDVGSSGFVSEDVTFAGSGANKSVLVWDATTAEVRVTLGRPSDHPRRESSDPPVLGEPTATYTPAPGLKDLGGMDVTASVSSTAVHF